MANAVKSATVEKSGSGVSSEQLQVAGTDRAKELQAFIASMSFSELSAAIMTRAHWNDVLEAANRLAKVIESTGIAEKTVTAQARKVGTLAPSDSMHFRLAITSYSLSGRSANPSQQAELAGKLPSLRKPGSLKANEATFGGIVLPPLLGGF